MKNVWIAQWKHVFVDFVSMYDYPREFEEKQEGTEDIKSCARRVSHHENHGNKKLHKLNMDQLK